MDGDRPMVDGRYILESRLQELVREVHAAGWIDGSEDRWESYSEDFFPKLHELLTSYFDSPTSDVGAQDEASEVREVGDSVRPKSHLIPSDPNAFVVDEWDPIRAIDDKFAREMELRFSYEGKKVAMGHCDLTKDPDGSIHASIKFFPQNPR